MPETESLSDFGLGTRSVRQAIGAPESVRRVLGQPGTTLVVIEASKVGRASGVTTDAYGVIESRCDELNLPKGTGVRACWCRVDSANGTMQSERALAALASVRPGVAVRLPPMTRDELAHTARVLFAGAPTVTRTLQSLRPYICPFEDLIGHVPAGSRVLDIGCGTGLFLGLLWRTGKLREGVGCDVNERSLQVAKTSLVVPEGEPTSLRFERCHDVNSWPGGTFDVVSMVDVIHHVGVQEQVRFIRQAASKVRPGGLLLYKDMVSKPAWRAWANRVHDLVMARQWINYLRLDAVERVALDAGMVTIVRGRANRFWYGHEYLVLRKA